MAITQLPEEINGELLRCSICSVALDIDKATAGFYDAHNKQAFACISHFAEVEKLVLGWVDFAAHERLSFLYDGEYPIILTYRGY